MRRAEQMIHSGLRWLEEARADTVESKFPAAEYGAFKQEEIKSFQWFTPQMDRPGCSGSLRARSSYIYNRSCGGACTSYLSYAGFAVFLHLLFPSSSSLW